MNDSESPMHRRTSQSAFSLIELLTVLAVVALLVAMLAPAIPRARHNALRVQCASNLRQIGAALVMYDQTYKRLPNLDNDHILFIKKVVSEPGGMEAELVISSGNPYPEELIKMKAATRPLFNCPTHKPDAGSEGMPSYAPNVFYSAAPITKGKGYYILAAEVDGPFGDGAHLAHRDSEPPGQLAPRRHALDKSNYLFFDGHVDLLTHREASGPDLNHWGTDHRKPTHNPLPPAPLSE